MMTTKTKLAALALAFFATPLSAQIVLGGERVARRAETRIPPGQLPPRGMCRVWIDGVPAGQQPPVTDCATAQRNRTANSRVIYGDQDTFRGRARGRFRNVVADTSSCTLRDAIVVRGRVLNVCRDAAVRRGGTLRTGRADRDDDRDDDGDDDDRSRLSKREKEEAKALRRAQKRAEKEARRDAKDSKGQGRDRDRDDD